MSEQFSVVREEWNRYRLLHDNTELRLKLPLTSVKIVTKEKGGGTADGNFGQIFYKEDTPEDTGPPSQDQKIAEQDLVREIEFERIMESLNIYDVPSIRSLLICRPSLVKITRTKKFGRNGKRIYRYETRLSVASISYPPEVLTEAKGKEAIGDSHEGSLQQ